MTRTFQAAPGIVGVDTQMSGRNTVTSAYLLEADEPTLVETGPATSADAVTSGLEALGIGPGDLANVVVTHIHLDHAGGAGTIARRFPRATIWVHERGAPHLADPGRLVASAARVYGEDTLRELFGPVEPVPPGRIRAIAEGDRVPMGNRGLDVIYTPGHASHHVALVEADAGAVFAGDALGIHLPDVGVLRPATPPPDIDVELAVESIGRIRDRTREMLMLSHFGPSDRVDALCEVATERLRTWAGIVREALDETDDLELIARTLEARTAAEFDEASPGADLERYEILASMRMNAMGLVRYWTRRAEADAETAARGSGGDQPS
ncbi:MAG: MBL fold metallo-hydrolase [Actinobacteria bacterium]|nr:MBL fold metallo-hydrolase [Actinomycetota bacterium]